MRSERNSISFFKSVMLQLRLGNTLIGVFTCRRSMTQDALVRNVTRRTRSVHGAFSLIEMFAGGQIVPHTLHCVHKLFSVDQSEQSMAGIQRAMRRKIQFVSKTRSAPRR